MMFRLIFTLFLAIGIGGCSDERFSHPMELVFFNESVATEAPPSIIGPVPPELQEIFWGKDVDTLMAELKDVMEDGILETDAGPVRDSANIMPKYLVDRICQRKLLTTYYTKYINAGGVAIIGNDYISDRYFYAAEEIVMVMTAKYPEIREHLTPTHKKRNDRNLPRRNFRMILYHTDLGIGVMPEYYGRSPFAIGFCTLEKCVVSVGRYPDPGDDKISIAHVFIHEFAHAMQYAIRKTDSTFDKRLKKAYRSVIGDTESYWGGSTDASALSNENEYWAFSATRWFLRFSLPTKDGKWHHEQFQEKDPMMYQLLQEYFEFQSLWYVESMQRFLTVRGYSPHFRSHR